MLDRIDKWIVENNPSAADLNNGAIEIPEWMGISENQNSVKIWDIDNGQSQFMGFRTLV